MKWFLLAFVVGVAEVATIAKLHSLLGLTNLIGIYVVATLLGVAFLSYRYKQFKGDFKSAKNLDKKFRKKVRKNLQHLEPEDFEKLKPMMSVLVYIAAVILVLIPGLITDLAGIVLLMPNVSSWIIKQQAKKVNEGFQIAP